MIHHFKKQIIQIKTIQKTIQKKLNEWLETIKDKGLSNDVKDNLLLSGGSIASMLLNSDVNDYDIYIQDMDILLQLTEHYIKSYNISILDGRKKDQLIEEDFSDNENLFTITVNNLKEDQIKLYFGGDTGLAVNEEKEKEDLDYEPVFFSSNAITLSNNIQIVTRFNGNPETIHKTFDFVHTTNYFTFEDGLVTNKKALESLLTKQLYYQGSMYPLTSIIRMKKFIKRGWNINAGEMLKIMFQISELNLKNPNVLEEQLIGVDIAYFSTLIEILRGIDSEKLTSNYINSIIDKVFNSAEDID